MFVSCLLFSTVSSQNSPGLVLPGVQPAILPGIAATPSPGVQVPAQIPADLGPTLQPNIFIPAGTYNQPTGIFNVPAPTTFTTGGGAATPLTFPNVAPTFGYVQENPAPTPGLMPGTVPTFLLNGNPAVPTGPEFLAIESCTVCSTFNAQNYQTLLSAIAPGVTVTETTCEVDGCGLSGVGQSKRKIQQPITLSPDEGVIVVSGPSASLNTIVTAVRNGQVPGIARTANLILTGVPSQPLVVVPNFPATPAQAATLISPDACVTCGTTCAGTSTTTSAFGTTSSGCACVTCSSVFPAGSATSTTYVFYTTSCSSQTTIATYDKCMNQLARASVCNNRATNNAALLTQGMFYNYPASFGLPTGLTNHINPIHSCHSGSKKGLLGLLGLLGLIPLLLCCLLLCLLCLRRKRAAPDVHFATFDPHPAVPCGPGPAGSLCAPSIAPGFGAPTALPVF